MNVVCESTKNTFINKYNCFHSICNSCYDKWTGFNCPLCRAHKTNINTYEDNEVYYKTERTVKC